jgi:hypothetical protein
MNELWVRLALIVGAMVAAFAIMLSMRAMRRERPTAIDPGGLGPGVYLFTSGTCLDCLPAREQITEVLGADGFVEVHWEEEPERFRELGIDEVPATIVVAVDGSAMLFSGMPAGAMKRFNP